MRWQITILFVLGTHVVVMGDGIGLGPCLVGALISAVLKLREFVHQTVGWLVWSCGRRLHSFL
jgi:hypothetical protein